MVAQQNPWSLLGWIILIMLAVVFSGWLFTEVIG